MIFLVTLCDHSQEEDYKYRLLDQYVYSAIIFNSFSFSVRLCPTVAKYLLMTLYVLSERQLHLLSPKKFDNTKQMSSASRLSSFWLGVFFAAITAESATSALAEIRSTVRTA